MSPSGWLVGGVAIADTCLPITPIFVLPYKRYAGPTLLSLAAGYVEKDRQSYRQTASPGGRVTGYVTPPAAARIDERPDVPLVVASTLLVPGYVDASEVGRIARFIADIDPAIPYSLLAFAPQFMMPDLPRTSFRHARAAASAAREAGLERVRIANRHLLS